MQLKSKMQRMKDKKNIFDDVLGILKHFLICMNATKCKQTNKRKISKISKNQKTTRRLFWGIFRIIYV